MSRITLCKNYHSLFSMKKKFKIICEKKQNKMLKHNTTHIQTYSIQTWQDICNGHAHTGIKLCTEFIQHNHFIHPTNSANRMVQFTGARLSRKGPTACLCHKCPYHPEQFLFQPHNLALSHQAHVTPQLTAFPI